MGHTPSTAGTLRKKFRRNSGKTPETLSERFLDFPSRVRLGSTKPYNSSHLRLPKHFQNSLPYGWGRLFFRSGSGEGLSELVMECPSVLRAFLIFHRTLKSQCGIALSCPPKSRDFKAKSGNPNHFLNILPFAPSFPCIFKERRAT